MHPPWAGAATPARHPHSACEWQAWNDSASAATAPGGCVTLAAPAPGLAAGSPGDHVRHFVAGFAPLTSAAATGLAAGAGLAPDA